MEKGDIQLSKQIAYSFGEMGKAMMSGIMGTYLIYFYIPTKQSGITKFISQKCYFGFITVMGVITLITKLFDALIDPWIANLSDRCTSRMGRRISFMRWSAFPFALSTVLVFCCPIGRISMVNSVYLTSILLLNYFFSTMYSTPYCTLQSELVHTSEQKINLSTVTSAAWYAGYGIASMAPILWNYIGKRGADKALSMRISFGIIALAGLICLITPVIAIDEKKYCEYRPSLRRTKIWSSVASALRNREFRAFVISNLFHKMSNGIFQSAMLYYITVLLGKSEGYLVTILILGGIGSLLCYFFINVVAKRIGKKKLIVIAFFICIFLYAYGAFLGIVPIRVEIQGLVMVLLVSPAMAIFGILPNAIAADIVQYDVAVSGERREGIFFGTRTLISKLGNIVSTFVLSGLLIIRLNNSNEIGVRLTFVASAMFSFLGLIFILGYNEKRVMEALNNR